MHVYSESFRGRIVVNLTDDIMFRAGTAGHYKMGIILGHLLKSGVCCILYATPRTGVTIDTLTDSEHHQSYVEDSPTSARFDGVFPQAQPVTEFP